MRSLLAVLAVGLFLSGCAPPWEKKTTSYDLSNSFGAYDVYRPQGDAVPRRAVVYFHGGGFMGGSKDEAQVYADDLCAKGYIVIAPNYRLSGPDSRWPAQLDDAWEALRRIRAESGRLGIQGPLAVMGVSAGGMIAMLTHLRDDPKDPGQRPCCCVDLSGEMDLGLGDKCFANWDQIMGLLLGPPPYDPAVLHAMSPVAFARTDAHVLMLHSNGDPNVFVANSDLMEVALAGTDTRFTRFTGWAHGDDMWTSCASARGEVHAFLDTQLR